MSPDKALEALLEGNKRFAAGKSTHKKWEEEARRAQSASQAPFAVILGCADSRSPPEIIFDQGLGDLFVVRVAGNVVGDTELASVEFAVAHLDSSVVMVLGHEQCGAVKTAITETQQLSELSTIYPMILSNVKRCKQQVKDKLTRAIQCNALGSVQQLKQSTVLSSHMEENKVKIVAAFYDFDTGKVSIIPE